MWSSDTLGLSAQAIAGWGKHHPHDPSDLRRCIEYWGSRSTADLQKRMAGRSTAWDRLLPHWDDLVQLLHHEMDTRVDGRAPCTYMEMRRVLEDGIACTACDSTGRGVECLKCKGTGRRCGGRCRAAGCHQGSGLCPTCHGRGYTKKEADSGSHRVNPATV